MEVCEVCKRPVEECICCPECGHICALDEGEYYCPVCLPLRKTKADKHGDIREEDVC